LAHDLTSLKVVLDKEHSADLPNFIAGLSATEGWTVLD
jgi:hypothetical protein